MLSPCPLTGRLFGDVSRSVPRVAAKLDEEDEEGAAKFDFSSDAPSLTLDPGSGRYSCSSYSMCRSTLPESCVALARRPRFRPPPPPPLPYTDGSRDVPVRERSSPDPPPFFTSGNVGGFSSIAPASKSHWSKKLEVVGSSSAVCVFRSSFCFSSSSVLIFSAMR
uniref:Uncharacterized protein n=1 Tax=Anopheles maculatus TaxID=74869 RepID=A0A182T5C2_9DIPT